MIILYCKNSTFIFLSKEIIKYIKYIALIINSHIVSGVSKIQLHLKYNIFMKKNFKKKNRIKI